ncbi:putative quinol monooxygenase [Fluviicola sp.]|uniref:putative quinol monooxygenase n=1 Tax=Fluviicola sp. TaxID=1917219 RepID=UPI0031D7CBBD
MKVYLTAIIKSKPEFTEEVKAVLQNMVIESRKEATCLRYDLHQGVENKNQFVFWEIWESKEALETHNQQPYIQAFREMAAEKLEQAPVISFADRI